MREHHALGHTGRAGGVDQEGEVAGWVDLGLAEASSAGDVADGGEVLNARLGVALVADEDDSVFWNAGFFRCRGGYLEEGRLRDEDFGAGVLELEGQLLGCVGWVGWRHDTASPDSTPHHGWGVDAVRGEEGQYVALLPVKGGLEALAKGKGGILDLLIGVGSLCVRILVDYWVMSAGCLR